MTKEETDFIGLVKANPSKAHDKLDNMFMDKMIGKRSGKQVARYRDLFKEYN